MKVFKIEADNCLETARRLRVVAAISSDDGVELRAAAQALDLARCLIRGNPMSVRLNFVRLFRMLTDDAKKKGGKGYVEIYRDPAAFSADTGHRPLNGMKI